MMQPFPAQITKWRDLRGLTQRQLAARLGTSSSSLCRWESGENTPKRDHVEKLDELLQASGRLLKVWETQTVGSSLPTWMRDLWQLKEEAVHIEFLSPVLVPGFLQSPGYARIVFEHGQPLATPSEIDHLVSMRCARYERLRERNDPEVVAVFPHSALTCVPDEVRREQASHLVSLARSGRVRTHLVPEGSALIGITSPLLLCRLVDGSRVASSDHVSGNVLYDEGTGFDRLSELVKRALGSAFPPEQSVQVLKGLST
ncbi:helix-turn-helix domain-containing protein [Nocardiopsis quinghaiensis]|uniref:helix-turn-helix domain-containing protein n=1 Tax=Nocardiopsis quinghaiensis TaxID=464995 RepID=UPI00123C0101|nr:Scr1 family TA system antitoxin-like transcriptional regulator [Nocardiopsis quinghaiensis]